MEKASSKAAIFFFIIVFMALLCVPVGADTAPYRTEQELMADFFALQSQYSSLLTYEIIGQTVEERPIYLFKLGNPDAPIIFLDAAMHGWEFIGSEALYYTVDWILEENLEVLQTNYILFVPVLNRDCYGFRRENINWVDLNRNYPTGWSSETYRSGPYPLSEPETQSIHSVLVNWQPRWYLNIHSGYAPTRITPAEDARVYRSTYKLIRGFSRQLGVSPFPYRLDPVPNEGNGLARFEGPAQGALTFELEIGSTRPDLNHFFNIVLPRFKAVLLGVCQENAASQPSTPEPEPLTTKQWKSFWNWLTINPPSEWSQADWQNFMTEERYEAWRTQTKTRKLHADDWVKFWGWLNENPPEDMATSDWQNFLGNRLGEWVLN